MKLPIVSILLSLVLWAEAPAIFGSVINVAKNDTLNVRAEADYKATKIEELPPHAFVGVEQCKIVKKSTWCKVYQLVQNNYYEGSQKGWVNAKYLKFSNRGYVNIKGKETHCLYALECKSRVNKYECLVVYKENYDYSKNKMIGIKTQWIERKNLKGESAFGAASTNEKINPEGGYCTNGKMIDDYEMK